MLGMVGEAGRELNFSDDGIDLDYDGYTKLHL